MVTGVRLTRVCHLNGCRFHRAFTCTSHHITSHHLLTCQQSTHTQTAINETTSVISVVSYQDMAPVTCTAAYARQQPQVDTCPPQQSLTLSGSCPDTLIAASSNPTYDIMQHLLIFSNRCQTETCQHSFYVDCVLFILYIPAQFRDCWIAVARLDVHCTCYRFPHRRLTTANIYATRNKKHYTCNIERHKILLIYITATTIEYSE
jgi:hypothetical protein